MLKWIALALMMLIPITFAGAEGNTMIPPQELGGIMVHHDMLTNASAEPGLTFATRPGGRAEVVEIRVAEGQNYVFIPLYWNNMVVYVEGETIPEQVEVVYTPWGGGIITPAEGRTLTEAFYVSDVEALTYSSVENIQQGDIALMDIRRYTTMNGELVEDGIAYLKAEDFPKELDGHRVNTTALGEGAFAKLTGDCWHHEGYGFPSIVDAQLPEGARELVIPTDLAGQGIVQVWLDNMDEGLRTIYQPYGLYVPLSTAAGLPRGVTYCKMLYADYAMVQADPALRQAFPDMGKDDYALVECDVEMAYDHEGNTWLTQIGFDPATLPTELRGHKLLLHPALNENVAIADYQQIYRGELDAEVAEWLGLPAEDEVVVTADESAGESDGSVYTHGELLYTRDDAQQTATIVGYELAEGQTELFIPSAIEGYTVVDFEYELVPLQIEKLWINLNTGKMFWNFGDKPTNHERLTYNYTQTTEDSITLEYIDLESWDEDGNMDSQRQSIDTEAVPETIAGNRVNITTGSGQTNFSGGLVTDGWRYLAYTTAEWEEVADILDCPDKDWGDTMVVPMYINGYRVKSIALEAIPESVHTVIMPGDGSMWTIVSSTPSNRVLRQITYTDWEGAGQSAMINRPAEMQKDELAWTRVLVHDFATGESLGIPHDIVSAADLPAEINGQRVINPEGAITVSHTSGDWEYMLDDYFGTNIEAYILAYNGEDEPGYLVVPETLDGNKIRAIHIDAIPESVKTIYVKGYNTSVFADNSNHSGEWLMVTYKDANKSMVTLQDVWKLTVEGGSAKQSWGTINVKDLPQEIDGKTVQVPNTSSFTYSSGEWEYYLHREAQTVAWITQSQLPEGITEMTVPKELDGYRVGYVDMAAIPQSVRTINIPKGCHVRTEQEKRPNLKIVEIK